MADEIKQPGNIGQVTPPAGSRGAGQRHRPRPKPERRDTDKRQPRPGNDPSHRIDEYV